MKLSLLELQSEEPGASFKISRLIKQCALATKPRLDLLMTLHAHPLHVTFCLDNQRYHALWTTTNAPAPFYALRCSAVTLEMLLDRLPERPAAFLPCSEKGRQKIIRERQEML